MVRLLRAWYKVLLYCQWKAHNHNNNYNIQQDYWKETHFCHVCGGIFSTMDSTSCTLDAAADCSLEERRRSGFREDVCSINRWVKSTSLHVHDNLFMQVIIELSTDHMMIILISSITRHCHTQYTHTHTHTHTPHLTISVGLELALVGDQMPELNRQPWQRKIYSQCSFCSEPAARPALYIAIIMQKIVCYIKDDSSIKLDSFCLEHWKAENGPGTNAKKFAIM